MSPDERGLKAATHRSGRAFERIAEAHLRKHGLTTLARNYSFRGGEIDLVMKDGDTLVFVEVRYRRSRRFGGAQESVTRTKQERVIRAARHYLAFRSGAEEPVCRFDVVAIHGTGPDHSIDWIAAAFSA